MSQSSDKQSQLFLGVDISGLRESVQFGILFASLLFFMCLYGLFQEMVIYDWFDRKLGIFTAALHFLGCILCAAVLHVSVADTFKDGLTSLVSAPKAPITSYLGLCVLKAMTQLFTNISMQHINFTTKILLKASLPVVTMILGFCVQCKTYPVVEMFSVLVLTIGLMVFLLGDDFSFPEGSNIGFACVFVSLITSALTPIWQEHLNEKYKASSSEMLLHIYTGSFLISLVLTFAFDEMWEGLHVLQTTVTPFNMMTLFCFCTFAFLGTNSSIGIIIRYGSVTNGICNSCRKVISILISILMFPDRNGVSSAQILGIGLFSAGLFLRSAGKKTSSLKAVTLPSVDINGGSHMNEGTAVPQISNSTGQQLGKVNRIIIEN